MVLKVVMALLMAIASIIVRGDVKINCSSLQVQ